METDFLPPDSTATGRWIVVADGARARIFEIHHHAPGLRPVLPYELTINRLRDHERWSDRAGASRDRASPVVHSKAPSTEPSQHEHELLAREVAKVLERGRVTDRLDSIALVASPRFLGHLRKALDRQTRALVTIEDDRDLSRLPEHELEERIPSSAWPTGSPPPRRIT